MNLHVKFHFVHESFIHDLIAHLIISFMIQYHSLIIKIIIPPNCFLQLHINCPWWQFFITTGRVLGLYAFPSFFRKQTPFLGHNGEHKPQGVDTNYWPNAPMTKARTVGNLPWDFPT